MLRTSRLSVPAFACATALLVLSARAQQGEDSRALDPALGLDPTVPQVGSTVGGMVPAFGQLPLDPGDWRFDYHGFLTAPLRMGLNEREDGGDTVLHAPPMVPDDLETFSHTGVVPMPYVQMNLSYGNSIVTGNVSVVARQANVSTGYFDPPSQLGVNDLFLRILPNFGKHISFKLNVGAFSNRYGVPGEYDEGRYGTPLIARINGVGENAVASFGFGDVVLLIEQGIQGQSNKAPPEVSGEIWNDYADPNVGASFVHHLHAGANYKGLATLGAHYIHAFTRDNRAQNPITPDGSMLILGADLRLTLGRFGHFYLATSHTDADSADSVGRLVEVLNTRGGKGLSENYFGVDSGGNGKLLVLGGQYELSIGRLVSYPTPFSGDGPDLYVGLFGLYANVTSDDLRHDGISKFKYGAEATYSLLSWFAASARYDRVAPNVEDDRYTFAVISPRLVFRSDWQATDQVVLQYSHWLNGSLTTIRTGSPPMEDSTAIPDEDMISLAASMWW